MASKVYACYLKDAMELRKSSSGGAYTAISNVILEQNGSIIACNYNYDVHDLEFNLITTHEQRNSSRGSKYIQADARSLFSLLQNEIEKDDGSPLMIIGTPCQVAAVKQWLKNKRVNTNRNILLCDILCHGVSSPGMWKSYISNIEKDKKLCFVTFKDKEKGWMRPTAKGNFTDGESVLLEDYALLYRSDDFMRESCYECPFSRANRGTDITIGDYWNINNVDREFMNPMGNSMVMVHTTFGEKIFEQAKKELNYLQTCVEEALQHNMKEPTHKRKRYNDIHKDYNRRGLDYIIEKYVHYGPGNSLICRIRRKIMRMRYEN